MVATLDRDPFVNEEPEVMRQVLQLVIQKRSANGRVLNSKRNLNGQALNVFWKADERSLILETKTALETVCAKYYIGLVHVNRLIVQVDQVRDDKQFAELVKRFSNN